MSFLGDVGGGDLRKEIVRAGGIDILKRVGAAGNPDVAKACKMAVTSITGNLWTRNAGSFSCLCYFHGGALTYLSQLLPRQRCPMTGVVVAPTTNQAAPQQAGSKMDLPVDMEIS